MAEAPVSPAPGTSAPTDTVEHAADVFAGLLFPTTGKPAAPAEPPADPTEPATPPGQPPIEPASSEPDEADEPAVDEPLDDPDASPAPAPRSRKLKLPDGTEQDVTEDEAYAGYLRTQDYTRKTQQAAEERRLAAEERRQAQEARAQHLALLDQTKQAMDALVPTEPDWAALRGKLSAEQYAVAQDNWRLFKTNRDAIVAKQKEVAAEMDADLQKDFVEKQRYEEQQLLAALPSWRDPAKAKAERGKLVEWLRGKGYTEEQISSVTDHRLVVSLRNAMLWEDLEHKTGKPKTRPTVRPAPSGGAPPAPKAPTDKARANAREKLQKSGKVADAAALIEQML